MATGDNPLGSVRVANTLNPSGGTDTSNPDPLGVEVEFDGQNHFIGPNAKIVIPTSGHAQVSAYAPVEVDDNSAAVKHPQSFPAEA